MSKDGNRERIVGALTSDEIKQVKDAFWELFDDLAWHPRIYFEMIRFALNTGLRVGELVALNVEDVWIHDNPRSTLVVKAESAKGDKQREVPLNGRAKDVVKGLIGYYIENDLPVEPEKPLWRSRQSNSEGERRISARSFQRKLNQINDYLWERNLIGIDLTPHALRHTFGTTLYKKTGDLRLVQELLGHSQSTTTERYTHMDRESKQEALDQIYEHE